MLLIDLPIFVATTVSTAFFYLCAQRELHPKDWKREIWFFPFVLALGIGVSINNARAVLGGDIQSQLGFLSNAKIWHREGEAGVEAKPLFCSANGDTTRGIYFRCVLHILCISCFSKQGISVSTVSNVVSNRVCLRGILFSLAALYAPAVESQGHFGSLKEDGKTFSYSVVIGRLGGTEPSSESLSGSCCVSGADAERGSGGHQPRPHPHRCLKRSWSSVFRNRSWPSW